MNLHKYIFSRDAPIAQVRHIIFWLLWWLYFLAARYFVPELNPWNQKTEYLIVGPSVILQSILILFIQMLACYAFIYFLLPQYLLKKKYLFFITGILLLGFAVVQLSHFIITVLLPFFESGVLKTTELLHKKTYWASISQGGINSIKITVAATAIIIGKREWLIQKEKERLEKGKIDTELQLLKAQIHPGFLFNTLNNIYSSAKVSSMRAPEMLLRLSDILSYMLYECEEPEVYLNKEIKMLEDYISLEKMRFGDQLDLNIWMKGDASGEKIAPLLLLSFIENSFKQCSNRMTEQPWINLEIQIENHVLEMKLMNGKPSDRETKEARKEGGLDQVQRRLQLLYPGSYELNISEESEIMMVNLQLKLQDLQESDDPLYPEDSTTDSTFSEILLES